MPHAGLLPVGYPVVSREGRWVSPGGPPGAGSVSAGLVHPMVDAEGRWVSDDRNPEARSLDEGFTASAPGGVRQPWEYRSPSGGSESYFGAPGDLWAGMVDWWFSHDIPTEGLPSGGGLMIGPQEAAKLGNFLKDALLPLMAGDIGLAGVGGLGRFDPLPIPAGQIIGKGVKGAKGAGRVIRGAVRGGDEAVEVAARVVRGNPAAGAWREAYKEAELVPIEFFDDMPSYNRGAARAGDVEIDVWSHRVKAEYEAMGERSFENFDELVDDMAEHGLDDPLMVDFNPNTGDVLLAEGNHRLAAARELGWDAIPVRVFRSTQTAAGRDAPIEKIMPTFGETKFGRSLDAFGEDMAQNISPSQAGMPTAGGVARETGEAVAKTDAEARAVIKSLEEKAAPAASGVVDKPMWHGSSQRFDTFSAGHSDERALFGLGVYTTDDMSVAVGYSQKRKRPISTATQIVARSDTPAGRALDEAVAGGAKRKGYVYNVVWRGKNPPRVLDLEATMPDEVRGVARRIVDSVDHPWVTDELPFAVDSELSMLEELRGIIGDPASTFEDFYRKLVRVFVESGQPSTEFIDVLQEMSDYLVEAGVDAFRHTGGKRVGKGHLHEAMIWLDSESVEIVQAGNIEGLLRNTGG